MGAVGGESRAMSWDRERWQDYFPERGDGSRTWGAVGKSSRKMVETNTNRLVSAHPSQFEDALRRLVMVEGVDPRDSWDRLLFDFRRDDLSSSALKEHLRRGILGLGPRRLGY